MATSNSTVAHRFANKDYNINRGLKGSSVTINGRNYYSYNTVFGQWVDDKVCIVYHGDTSQTSNQHKLYSSDFPSDVTLFPYDDGGRGYNFYHGCDLLGWKGEFDLSKRYRLMDYWVGEIYNALSEISGGKKKGLEVEASRAIEEYWPYMAQLCKLYKDTTVKDYIERQKGTKAKILVEQMNKGVFDVPALVDAVFGRGVWKTYYDYCARYRKAADKKQKMIALCKRLGFKNPYREGYWSEWWQLEFSVDEIRNMTARERLDHHFEALYAKEVYDGQDARKAKKEKNADNAYKWITGYEPKFESEYNHHYEAVRQCRNMFTGKEYTLPKNHIFGFHWVLKRAEFNYDSFRIAEDKEQWIREFYDTCQRVQDNCIAITMLEGVGAHTKEKVHSWDDDIFIDDDYLRTVIEGEDYELCKRFIEQQDKHYADKAARTRAAEIERRKREEEERREKELRELLDKAKIEACKARGIEGYRDLWRLHYVPLWSAEQEAVNMNVFYFGGNILLRFSMNKDMVESSKRIRLTIASCKAMWKVVSKWHENPSIFKPMTIKTLDGTYTISSYHNDILTAGCHQIAYAEMAHMYNEIVELEKNANEAA